MKPEDVTGDWVKHVLKLSGHSQRELAEYLDRDPALVSRSIKNRRAWKPDEVFKLIARYANTEKETEKHIKNLKPDLAPIRLAKVVKASEMTPAAVTLTLDTEAGPVTIKGTPNEAADAMARMVKKLSS